MNSSVETHNWTQLENQHLEQNTNKNLYEIFSITTLTGQKPYRIFRKLKEIFTEVLNETKKLLTIENPNERRTTVEFLTQVSH